MNGIKTIKGISVALGVLIGLLVLVSAIVLISGITIQLDFLRPAIEKGATEALGRPVRIEGSIKLIPTLRPTVTVSGVKIDNPPNWPKQLFVSVTLVRTQIDLLDLLSKEINIGEITADGIVLYLASNTQGGNNWDFSAADEKQPPQKKAAEAQKMPATTEASSEKRRIRFMALDELSLTNIAVDYRDAVMKKAINFRIDEYSGSAKAGEPVQFTLNGSLQGHEYSFGVEGGSLVSLRDGTSSWPLKISGKVAGIKVDAAGELDRQAEEPKLHLGFSLGKVDIGAILAWLKLTEGVDASTDRFSLEATLMGNSLHELVTRSQLSVSLEGGQWMLQDPNTQAKLPIRIVDGSIRVVPDQPVSMTVNGKIDQTPVSFTIAGMSLADLTRQPEAITIQIGAQAAGAKLTLDGQLAMPMQSRDASLVMTLEGDTLDSLEELLQVDMPPFGPYTLKSRFAVVKTGYELSDLHLKVGDSELDGAMKLDTAGAKPLTDVHLTSKRVQLDDFSLEGWSPETRKVVPTKSLAAEGEGAQPSKAKKIASLLSSDVLSAFDAKLNVEVAQVLSGADILGGGLLDITVKDGRLSVDPLRLDLPGGSVQLGFAYRPTATDANVQLSALVDQFDVGILVRRIDPDKKLGGRLSLNVELDGTAPDLKRLLANTSGHFDFAFWPENLDAGIVDLWAVNLITVLSEQVDDEPNSTLNCMVARFDLKDGLMQEKIIFMDTTRMSVSGDATINFQAEEIDALAAPKAKRPEYFSLATPVKIHGTFSDFGIGINKLSLAKTAVSFITSPITVPFKRLFAGKVPEDGKVACEEAWQMDLSDN